MAYRRLRRFRWRLEEVDLDLTNDQTEREVEAELRHVFRCLLHHMKEGLFRCLLMKVLIDYVEEMWNRLAPEALQMGVNLELEIMEPPPEAESGEE